MAAKDAPKDGARAEGPNFKQREEIDRERVRKRERKALVKSL